MYFTGNVQNQRIIRLRAGQAVGVESEVYIYIITQKLSM